MEIPTLDEISPLGFTERFDISIFIQYPDIDFDPETKEMDAGEPQHFSSPASGHAEHYDTDSGSKSTSTPHTTPSRHEAFQAETASLDEHRRYLRQLQTCDLPPRAIQYFRSLADQILAVASHLQPKTLYLSGTTTRDVLVGSEALLHQLQQSITRIQDQSAAINYITSLAPFNMVPTDLALWTNYRQRANLIIKHLSLPSPAEYDMLSGLLTLFDAYVYSAFLHFPRYRFPQALSTRINDLYNAFLTLVTSYSTWLRLMTHLKQTYMTPILRRIQDSSWVKTEINQMEEALEACKRMNACPIQDIIGSEVGEEQIKGAVNLAERRSKSSIAIKERTRKNVQKQGIGRTRVRREHTL